MEKSQEQFVQECLAEVESLKERIAALEAKLQAFQADESQAAVPDLEDVPEDAPVDFTDIDMEVPVGAEDALSSAKNLADATERASSAPDKPSSAPVNAMKETDETAGLHWRTDKPGLRVKNIRSGISLYDRALFIGSLFKEDFSLYEKTIADLNEMVSMDQAVDYIRSHFPDWNLKSDVVYNFMMSVRKKLG